MFFLFHFLNSNRNEINLSAEQEEDKEDNINHLKMKRPFPLQLQELPEIPTTISTSTLSSPITPPITPPAKRQRIESVQHIPNSTALLNPENGLITLVHNLPNNNNNISNLMNNNDNNLNKRMVPRISTYNIRKNDDISDPEKNPLVNIHKIPLIRDITESIRLYGKMVKFCIGKETRNLKKIYVTSQSPTAGLCSKHIDKVCIIVFIILFFYYKTLKHVGFVLGLLYSVKNNDKKCTKICQSQTTRSLTPFAII